MASAGIFNWQETVSSEFSAIVSPTILHRVWSRELVEPLARYTVFCCKLNLGFTFLEEELQILASTDTVSPIKNKSDDLIIHIFIEQCYHTNIIGYITHAYMY